MNSKVEPKSDAGKDAAGKKLKLLSSPKFRGRLILSAPQENCPTAQMIAAYLEGRLSWFERKRYERHLNRCPACLHLLSRTYKEEIASPFAASRENVEERSFLPSFLPYSRKPLMAAAAAALLVLVSVSSLQVYRYLAGLENTSMTALHAGDASVFLHSSFIEKESLRSRSAEPGSREKKVTPRDLLRVDFPFNPTLQHWGFLFFKEQGDYINGLSMDRIGTDRESTVRLLRGGSAKPSVDVLDDLGLLEVRAADLLGASFGRITMVAISTKGQINPEKYRILADDLQHTFSMGGKATEEILRKRLAARLDDTPFMVGTDHIHYLQNEGEEGTS